MSGSGRVSGSADPSLAPSHPAPLAPDHQAYEGCSLFKVHGVDADSVHTYEVADEAASLCSGDPFLLQTPGTIFLWKGKQAGEAEVSRSAARIPAPLPSPKSSHSSRSAALLPPRWLWRRRRRSYSPGSSRARRVRMELHVTGQSQPSTRAPSRLPSGAGWWGASKRTPLISRLRLWMRWGGSS